MPKTKSKRQITLDEAAAAVLKSRQDKYGRPEDNFWRIANLWNTHLVNRGLLVAARDGQLTPTDVASMLILLKLARLVNTPGHQDSWSDAAGYAACGAEVSDAS